MHGALFQLKRESFNVVLYGFIGVFKICFLVFNLVPWLAVLMMS
jgi:preprotein translocase subunit SecD